MISTELYDRLAVFSRDYIRKTGCLSWKEVLKEVYKGDRKITCENFQAAMRKRGVRLGTHRHDTERLSEVYRKRSQAGPCRYCEIVTKMRFGGDFVCEPCLRRHDTEDRVRLEDMCYRTGNLGSVI